MSRIVRPVVTGLVVVAALVASAAHAAAQDRSAKTAKAPVVSRAALAALKPIYVIPGAKDVGDLATAVVCSNVSGRTATIRLVAHTGVTGVKEGETTVQIVHAGTAFVTTHDTVFHEEDVHLNLATSHLQGLIYVESTEANAFCTATVLYALSLIPETTDLHVIRLNPAAGAQG